MMSVHFSQELDDLKGRLLAMAGHAENAVQRALQAYVNRDDHLARRVREDDTVLDELELEIDELSIRLLAEAPLAFDLRLITIAVKICQNLERIGDEATTIARRVVQLNAEPELTIEVDLPQMADLGLRMLKDALDAFVEGDPAAARSIIPRDRKVDSLNKQFQRVLADCMTERPATITRCLHLMTISKSLERIADHATNIAEEVVYLFEGEDIRHNPAVKRAAPGEPS